MQSFRTEVSRALGLLAATVLVVAGGLVAAVPAAAAEVAGRPALEAQVLLDCAGFSPGAIDGLWGSNTRGALTAFQRARGLEPSSEFDDATREALGGGGDVKVVAEYRITAEDVSGPYTESIPDDLEEQAELDALLYTGPAEELAERFHTTEEVLKALNPDAGFEADETIKVPAAGAAAASATSAAGGDPRPVAKVTVSKSQLSLIAEDAEGKVVFYAPVTAGSEHDPLPIGDWEVVAIARDPTFHYNPELFWDAEPSDDSATVPPGPNNPVGKVWIDLDKEHYGLHGTPDPSTIGHVASHGCVRLTNWDALHLAELVETGTPVLFRE